MPGTGLIRPISYCLLALAATPLLSRTLAAQARAPDSVFVAVRCEGQVIDSVAIHRSGPRPTPIRQFLIAEAVANVLQVTTRESVVRNLLLLAPGDRCDELRRVESERLLRSQPFIADAQVRLMRAGTGTTFLSVQTSDEAAIIIGARLNTSGNPVRAFRFGNSNIAGTAVRASASWESGGTGYRDGYGMRFTHFQPLGKPYLLEANALRFPLGDEWLAGASHPFRTGLQRFAWHALAGGRVDYIRFRVASDTDRALKLDRRYFDIGTMARVGPPNRYSLFGASISSDDERPASRSILTTADGVRPDTNSTLTDRYTAHRMSRVNALIGVRDVEYIAARGFDALRATQDVPVGIQGGLIIGRSLPMLGGEEDDVFLASDLYLGVGGADGMFRIESRGEARKPRGGQWDGFLTSGRATQLLKLPFRQTFTASLEWAAGARLRVPFALSLSDRAGGVRGYGDVDAVGARRAVARIEDRVLTGRISALGVFFDAGRLWAADAPFGEDTPVRTSAGLSVFAAVPAQSHRTLRMDVAFALNPEPGGDRVQLVFTSADLTRMFLREPRDVERTRERTVPASIFRWP
jgi:hypothetical protein